MASAVREGFSGASGEYLPYSRLGGEMVAETVRVNINISPELHAFYREQADRAGVSMSAYMALALLEYKDRWENERCSNNQRS